MGRSEAGGKVGCFRRLWSKILDERTCRAHDLPDKSIYGSNAGLVFTTAEAFGSMNVPMDYCSGHRGQKAIDRLKSQWPNAILVRTPIHAGYFGSIKVEIYFSSRARKSPHAKRLLWPNSNNVSWLSKVITRRPPPLSSGLSSAAICMCSWPNSTPNVWQPPLERHSQ
jgi:hypothetical protein